jgi:hypothetical protein
MLDPIEYTGRDNSIKAEPRGVAPAPVTIETDIPLEHEIAEPAAEPDASTDAVASVASVATAPTLEPGEKLYPLHTADALGRVRRDLDPLEIAKCSPMQKEKLFDMLGSLEIAEQSETVHYTCKKNTSKAETALGRSRKAFEAVSPKRTFHDEWRETVAKLPPVPVSDETKQAVADALVVIEQCEQHLASCQSAELAAKKDEHDKRATYARAAIEFSKWDGIAKDVASLVRARSATERRIAMANLEAGLPVDHGTGPVDTTGPSHLDRFRKGMGKGSSANRGYNMNRMRGATVPVKPR